MTPDAQADTSPDTSPDTWIGVALAEQIPPESTHPVTIRGTQVALWRGESGAVKVWSDRCPHRGMRLSHGYVEGDRLRCIYHGWAYGEGGQCVSIPAHPDLTPPRTICVNRYATETRLGIVWTNLDPDAEATLPDFELGEDWTPVRSLYLNCTPTALRSALESFEFPSPGTVTQYGARGVSVAMANATTLFCAIQPIENGKTALHAVMSTPTGDDKAPVIAMARRLETFRRHVEAA